MWYSFAYHEFWIEQIQYHKCLLRANRDNLRIKKRETHEIILKQNWIKTELIIPSVILFNCMTSSGEMHTFSISCFSLGDISESESSRRHFRRRWLLFLLSTATLILYWFKLKESNELIKELIQLNDANRFGVTFEPISRTKKLSQFYGLRSFCEINDIFICFTIALFVFVRQRRVVSDQVSFFITKITLTTNYHSFVYWYVFSVQLKPIFHSIGYDSFQWSRMMIFRRNKFAGCQMKTVFEMCEIWKILPKRWLPFELYWVKLMFLITMNLFSKFAAVTSSGLVNVGLVWWFFHLIFSPALMVAVLLLPRYGSAHDRHHSNDRESIGKAFLFISALFLFKHRIFSLTKFDPNFKFAHTDDFRLLDMQFKDPIRFLKVQKKLGKHCQHCWLNSDWN